MKKISFVLIALDILIITGSFFAVNYLRTERYLPSLLYFKLLILILCSAFLGSIISKKYRTAQYTTLKSGLLTIATSTILLTYIASFVILLRGLYAFSRGQLFGTVLLAFMVETVSYLAYFIVNRRKIRGSFELGGLKIVEFKDFSLSLLFNDIIFLLLSFFLMTYIKRRNFNLSQQYSDILFLIVAIWLATSLFTKKFNVVKHLKFAFVIASFIKAYILALLTMTVLTFIFRLFYYSRLHFFGTFTIHLFLETISTYLNYMTWVYEPKKLDVESSDELRAVLRQEDLPLKKDITTGFSNTISIPIMKKIYENLSRSHPQLVAFITNDLKIANIAELRTYVLETENQYNVETIADHSLHLFINLHKVNDFKRINRYFLTVHQKIDDNGFFVSCAETNEVIKKKLLQGSFEFIGHLLYGFHFLFHRVLPKSPGLKKIYFLITRGRERALSKAEVLGRLYFCGFKIVAEEYINDRLYFIAQRVKYPSVITNPSYGLTVRLPRIGMNGEIKYIYKFRTMHPYSEFLQAYIYEKCNLDKSGKMADDFRLTEWGKLFRKLWIDELPQLINFFQGDLAIFGVRALSQQYFNLYPKELQDLRTQFKPGLIPPYYADLPESFEEILDSEKRYLEKKKVAPIRTDISYLFKALYNIFINKARSK